MPCPGGLVGHTHGVGDLASLLALDVHARRDAEAEHPFLGVAKGDGAGVGLDRDRNSRGDFGKKIGTTSRLPTVSSSPRGRSQATTRPRPIPGQRSVALQAIVGRCFSAAPSRRRGHPSIFDERFALKGTSARFILPNVRGPSALRPGTTRPHRPPRPRSLSGRDRDGVVALPAGSVARGRLGPVETRALRRWMGESLFQASAMAKRLYVGNLAYSVTSEELQELFEQYGKVTWPRS